MNISFKDEDGNLIDYLTNKALKEGDIYNHYWMML